MRSLITKAIVTFSVCSLVIAQTAYGEIGTVFSKATAERPTLALGEPLVLDLVIKATATITGDNVCQNATVAVDVAGPGVRDYEHIVGPTFSGAHRLFPKKANDATVCRLKIFLKRKSDSPENTFVFSQSGTWFVRVRSDNFTQEVGPLIISEPVGDDRLVWEQMQRDVDLAFFVQSNSPLALSRSKLNEYAQMFPQHRIGKAAARALELRWMVEEGQR